MSRLDITDTHLWEWQDATTIALCPEIVAWAETEGFACTVVTAARRRDPETRQGFVIETESIQVWFDTDLAATAFKMRWWGHEWPWAH